jgi:Family of unknown function (DUF6444)
VPALEPPSPSYEELAARVETLEAENAELRRRLGMNSTNYSVPPSNDSLGEGSVSSNRVNVSVTYCQTACFCASGDNATTGPPLPAMTWGCERSTGPL